MTIALEKLRTLDLAAAPAPGRPLHLSAASGLTQVGSYLYVVADDELHLGVFAARGNAPGRMTRLFKGALPDAKTARKKRKPDLEALVLLPKSDVQKHGALLAFGSGSKRTRRMGALLALDARGAVHGTAQAVDLTALLARLDDEFAALNIEGATVQSGELRLFQRANTGHADNAIVRFKLDDVLKALRTGRTRALAIVGIDRLDLGRIKESRSASPTRRHSRAATRSSPPSRRTATMPMPTARAWGPPSASRTSTAIALAAPARPQGQGGGDRGARARRHTPSPAGDGCRRRRNCREPVRGDESSAAVLRTSARGHTSRRRPPEARSE